MIAICFSSLLIWPRKLRIFWLANDDVLSITARASAFAAQPATLRFAAWTLSETSGVWPFFEIAPETVCVEIPPRKAPALVLHSAATALTMLVAWAITLTVLGFVCAAWRCTFPLAEYGCPRYSVAVACHRWLPPSET